MKVNADFSIRAAEHADTPWVQSPMPGVERRMLDRIGDEVARATTIVRFAKGSAFSPHTHGGGEEYIVLDGVFQDEDGDFPKGTYVRNPPTTHHTPASDPGCTIFVKLWQMDPDDRHQMAVDTGKIVLNPLPGRPGVMAATLFSDPREAVRIEEWTANTEILLPVSGGLEILVLDGEFHESDERFSKHSWLRLPAGGMFHAQTGTIGARVWIKEGHLSETPKAPATAST